jgi:hypothetical protein
MPAPGAGGVQTSLVGTVQGMMASARAAFRRKPPPEQRRGATVQSPGGDKNNPADLSQFAEDFVPSGGLFERGAHTGCREALDDPEQRHAYCFHAGLQKLLHLTLPAAQ